MLNSFRCSVHTASDECNADSHYIQFKCPQFAIIIVQGTHTVNNSPTVVDVILEADDVVSAGSVEPGGSVSKTIATQKSESAKHENGTNFIIGPTSLITNLFEN